MRRMQFSEASNHTSSLLGAQGRIWANPAPGLYFEVVDPHAAKCSKVAFVKIPSMNENIMTITIQTMYAGPLWNSENFQYNKLVYDYCMRFVYKFLDGELTKEQINEAAEEAIRLGGTDRLWSDMLALKREPILTDYQRSALNILSDIAIYYPKTQIKLELNKKQYIFKYSSHGKLIIEFPWY